MIRFILRTSTVAMLRAAHARITGSPEAAFATLAQGIDADDVGLLIEPWADKAGIEALGNLAASSLKAWEIGELDGGDDVCADLTDAISTLSDAMDEAREGEMDGLAAAREEHWAHGDDTHYPDSYMRNDAGEYLGIH